MCHIDIGVGCRTKVEFDTITINKKNDDTRKRTISIFDTSYIEADTIATFDIYIKAFVQYILLCLHRQHGGARFDAIIPCTSIENFTFILCRYIEVLTFDTISTANRHIVSYSRGRL